jgi:hypothetical protein
MPHKGECRDACGCAIGGAEGVDDAGRRGEKRRRGLYRCAYGRKYPWKQHGDAGAGGVQAASFAVVREFSRCLADAFSFRTSAVCASQWRVGWTGTPPSLSDSFTLWPLYPLLDFIFRVKQCTMMFGNAHNYSDSKPDLSKSSS